MNHNPSTSCFDFQPMQQSINQIYKLKKPPDRDGHRSNSLDTCQIEISHCQYSSSFYGKDPKSSNTERIFTASYSVPTPLMAFNLSSSVKPQNSRLLAVKTLAFTVPINSLRALLRLYWRPSLVEDIQFTHEEGVFRVLMKFYEDKRQIVQRRIWIMNNFLVLVEDWKCFCELDDLCFRHADFKVQLLNLPRPLMGEEVIRSIIKRVGEVSQVSLFLGVPVAQVKMDLRKPFWPTVPTVFRCMQIWVSLAFENLRNVCYSCGILGHSSKQCKFVSKPFACQFHATNGDFPYMKLGKRMKDFTRMNFQQNSAVLLGEQVCQGKGCDGDFDLNHVIPNNPVDAMDKICDIRHIESESELLVPTTPIENKTSLDNAVVGNIKEDCVLLESVENPGKIERISETTLRQQLIFGEPFSAKKSNAIFQQSFGTSQGSSSNPEKLEGDAGLRATHCPLRKIIQEGQYPITNFFSPQYSVLVANFLMRRHAKISVQASLIEDSPSVVVHLSCSKDTLKRYHRRARTKAPQPSTPMKLRSSVDWVAEPPLAKVRKLKHVEDINLDARRNIETNSEIPVMRKRKVKDQQKGIQMDSKSKDEESTSPAFLDTQNDGKQLAFLDEPLKSKGPIDDSHWWKLSKDEEIALSALSRIARWWITPPLAGAMSFFGFDHLVQSWVVSSGHFKVSWVGRQRTELFEMDTKFGKCFLVPLVVYILVSFLSFSVCLCSVARSGFALLISVSWVGIISDMGISMGRDQWGLLISKGSTTTTWLGASSYPTWFSMMFCWFPLPTIISNSRLLLWVATWVGLFIMVQVFVSTVRPQKLWLFLMKIQRFVDRSSLFKLANSVLEVVQVSFSGFLQCLCYGITYWAVTSCTC